MVSFTLEIIISLKSQITQATSEEEAERGVAKPPGVKGKRRWDLSGNKQKKEMPSEQSEGKCSALVCFFDISSAATF